MRWLKTYSLGPVRGFIIFRHLAIGLHTDPRCRGFTVCWSRSGWQLGGSYLASI